MRIGGVKAAIHREGAQVAVQFGEGGFDLGMNVVFASDNVRDSWSPYGKADMLERVALAGYLFGWNDDASLLQGLDRVTTSPSRISRSSFFASIRAALMR